MCGIAGIYLKDPTILKSHSELERFVNVMFKGIEDRGKHASGFVACTVDGKVVIDKAAKAASEFIKDRERIPTGARAILLHTRYATKGKVENHLNNHPVISRTCFVTHNGSIDNDDALFEEHKLNRHGEVDSEAIAAMLAEYGLDDVQKTMEALEGPVAIAAIDPINSPGKLLLAKGVQSPLVYHDAGKFLVWASTAKTLKDAWAAVLGTPPADKKFKYMQEGTALLYDGFTVTEEKFKPPNRYKDYSRHASQTGHKPYVPPNTGFGMYGLKDPPRYLVGLIKTRRDNGEGQSRTFAEHSRLPYENLANHSHLAWQTCIGCHQQVISMDMRYVTGYGKVCLDCKEALDDIEARLKDAEKPKQLALPAGDPTKKATDNMSPLALTKMTQYAQLETVVHQECLKEVEKVTGLDYDLIDFILHRAILDVVEKDDKWNALFLELEELYSIAQDNQWRLYDADKGDDLRDSWEEIIDGDLVKQTQESVACSLGDTPEVVEPDTLDYAECKTCGTYTWPGERKCTVCEQREAMFAEPDPVVVEKCEKCRRKPKAIIVNEDVGLGWCDKHLNTCHRRGCNKMPVAFTFAGEWLCHNHTRKVKGLCTIKQAQDKGYSFVTLGGEK